MNYLVNFQPVQLAFSGQFSTGVNKLFEFRLYRPDTPDHDIVIAFRARLDYSVTCGLICCDYSVIGLIHGLLLLLSVSEKTITDLAAVVGR